MVGTKSEEKEISRDQILQASISEEEFRSSLEGTGEPQQIWDTEGQGQVCALVRRL